MPYVFCTMLVRNTPSSSCLCGHALRPLTVLLWGALPCWWGEVGPIALDGSPRLNRETRASAPRSEKAAESGCRQGPTTTRLCCQGHAALWHELIDAFLDWIGCLRHGIAWLWLWMALWCFPSLHQAAGGITRQGNHREHLQARKSRSLFDLSSSDAVVSWYLQSLLLETDRW